MKRKLRYGMKLCRDRQALSDLGQIDDSYIGGECHCGRRGGGAEGKVPFVAAVMTSDQYPLILMRFSIVTDFNNNDNWAKSHLFPRTIVLSDGLNYFSGVKDAGSSYQVIVKNHITKIQRYSEIKWVDTMIGNVKNFIHRIYYVVSEKQNPRYLAEFCFRLNRRFKLGRMIRQLVQAAVNTLPMPQRIFKLPEVRW